MADTQAVAHGQAYTQVLAGNQVLAAVAGSTRVGSTLELWLHSLGQKVGAGYRETPMECHCIVEL